MTRARTVGWLLVAIVLVVVFGIYGSVQANTYFNGEALTAHVDSCETHRVHSRHGSHNKTTCDGTWKTADGRTHSGEIDSADASDEGGDIQIRADGDSAIVDSPWELWPLGVAAVGLLLVVLACFAVRTAWRRTAQGSGNVGYRTPTMFRGSQQGHPPAPGPGYPPGQPGYPPPGYPPQGQPGYPPPGYPPQGQPGYPPGRPPGYPPPGQQGYPPAQPPQGYRGR